MSEIHSKRNAGEWAEFYVLLNVLSEGRLYAADGSLNKLNDNYFPVISIEMQRSDSIKQNPIPVIYHVDTRNKEIKVESDGCTDYIKMIDFKDEADRFFKIISSRKGRAFLVPEISSILDKLKNPVTKQSSSKKADIHIVIHDVMTGFENEVGFSIKSKHSSPATLINASGQTLFQYKITKPYKINDTYEISNLLEPHQYDRDDLPIDTGPKGRVKLLLEAGYFLSFNRIKSNNFQENILIIDSSLDVILSECLLVFMSSKITSLSEIVDIVAVKNPCNFTTKDSTRLLDFYKYKIKRLIVDAALGMQPKRPWSGEYDASGGYIVVKETGDVVCYHLYNWNALQDYLYYNLRFETPSSTGQGSKKSYNYALHYTEHNNDFMDICLQLRFK
ncbi:HpaII family restriction endonuclease [Psychromonas sp. Urea-02u-13]|uniref:HpaII family restriction endonuclease n=1 Tax=Psychromonas sp. Urea-02u-13 TaxID=2058326 RepID=UPI0012FF1054|nr:HpaII family restriction endonuclease [Psychromonas sp. Urea-02u-13]